MNDHPEKPRHDGECLQERISAAHTAYTDAVDIVRRSRGLSRSWRDHLAGVLENKRDRVLQILDIKEPQGLLARLTPEQKATVLAYTGPENFGDASSASPPTAALGTQEGERFITESIGGGASNIIANSPDPMKRLCLASAIDKATAELIVATHNAALASQARTIEALRVAIRPFADFALLIPAHSGDDELVHDVTDVSPRVKDFRRALKEHPNG